MAFLRNTWYCAGWAYELEEDGHYARKLLGESVLVMRKVDGSIAAIGNACPHRFAPLSKGKRTGDVFACPYHGLAFDSEGVCVLNPNEEGSGKPGTIPKSAKVKPYPLIERYGALWIWMGDIEKADDSLIPDFSMASERKGWAVIRGMSFLKNANYQMVVDNLMDRTHVQYLHPILQYSEAKADNFERIQRIEQTGNTVWDYHTELHSPDYPVLKMMWPECPEDRGNYLDVRWDAPSNMLLHQGTYDINNPEVGAFTEAAHLITPADENNSYYFWNQARSRNIDDRELDEKMRQGIAHVTEFEDGQMIADCAELMGTHDLMSLKPCMLPSDAGPVRTRLILKKLIEDEQAELAAAT